MSFARKSIAALAVTATALFSGAALADVFVGGQAMMPAKNIIQNAVNSADHTTLVAAVKAAGLVDTLQGPGPFTVFAPVNSAFAMLPAGTVDTLLKPENKGQLTSILTYHVVPGRVTYADLKRIAEWILPKEHRPSMYEIPPFVASLSSTGSGPLEVVVPIRIEHRQRFFDPVDDCEDRCLKEMQGRLAELRVPNGRSGSHR